MIRKMTPQGTNWIVTTIGGQLNQAHGAADGVGVQASFYHPASLAVDSQGRVFVADYMNNIIRMGTPPALQIASSGGAAFVMLPFSNTNFVIHTATSPAGPWQTVAGGVTTNLVFSGPMTNSHNFYRLLQQ